MAAVRADDSGGTRAAWYAVYIEQRGGHGQGWPKVLEVLSVHPSRDEALRAARLDAAIARAVHHAEVTEGDAVGRRDFGVDGAPCDKYGRVVAVNTHTELRVEKVKNLLGYARAVEAVFAETQERALIDAALARAPLPESTE